MTQTHSSDGGWHLDKRVPIALIVTLVLQAVVFTRFLVAMDYRIASLESSALKTEDIPTDLAVVKQQISSMHEDIGDLTEQQTRIESKIDRLGPDD